MRNWLLVITAAVFLAACESGSDSPLSAASPTRTPLPLAATSTPPAPENPFSIVGPVSPDEFFAEIYRPTRHFILDRQTGLVYYFEIHPESDVQLKSDVYIRWNGPALAVTNDGMRYTITLDGRAANVPEFVGDNILDRVIGNESSSGNWDSGTLASGEGGVLFGDSGRKEQFHVSAAQYPTWAPTEDLLAMQGNLCDDNDILVLDPETKELTNITADVPPASYFAWKQDSSALAVFVPRQDGVNLLEIRLDGSHDTILSSGMRATLVPIEWSADGRFLIVQTDPAPFAFCTQGWGGDSQVDQEFGGP